jgi:ketosteroid isomerase-like protein
MSASAVDIAHSCLQAYVDKDRPAIESLLAEDFHFTSPIDNALDRQTYLARCWPNSASMESADVLQEASDGGRALLVYEARTSTGKRFRNAEVHTVRDGKLVSVDVYFGWTLPHRAPAGGYVDNDGDGHA